MQKKVRTTLHKAVDPMRLIDPEFAALQTQFRAKIALAIELGGSAMRHTVPFGVVVFDSWYLAEDLLTALARRRNAWVSSVKKNRNIEMSSFALWDVAGQPIRFAGPHLAIEDLIPLFPPMPTVRLRTARPPIGASPWRLVISFANAKRTGTAALFLSNRLDWSVQKILTTYLRRWPTETLYQDGNGHLGLDA